MLNIRRILLPVDFPNVSLPVIHQAATLARRFHSEIVMLHVMTQASYAAGAPSSRPKLENWDLLAKIIGEPRESQDQVLEVELAGLPIRRILVEGDPAQAIVETARQEEADLIMMPSYGYVFKEFLLGSVTANGRGIWRASHAGARHSQRGVLGPGRKLRQRRLEEGPGGRRFSAYGRTSAGNGRPGKRVYRQR
jgi:nucleotide-binding universal stress UspA family protein